MLQTEILEKLKLTIQEYDPTGAAHWAGQAMEAGVDPLAAFGVLTDAIREIGEAFGRGDLWLPELVGAADAMQAATPVIEDALRGSGKRRDSLGVVLIGTVFGDIHTIGKSMVATLLTAQGFEVRDLGINVPTRRFVEAVREYSPDLLAMSALLTTTAPEAKKVMDALVAEGLRGRVKVMVGGGAVTEDYAMSIGADGYDPSAPGAADVAKRLLGIS